MQMPRTERLRRMLVCLLVSTCCICLCLACSDSADGTADGDVPQFQYQPEDGDGEITDEQSEQPEDGDTEIADSVEQSEPEMESEEDEHSETDGDSIDGDDDGFEYDAFEANENEHEEQADIDEQIPTDVECLSFNDCPGEDICDLSLGRCDRRKSLSTFEVELYGFHPPQVAIGDLLVIDGNGFLGSNPIIPAGFSVMVGPDVFGGLFSGVMADENRLLVPVTKELGGNIMVSVNGFNSNQSAESLMQASDGLIDCDSDTPAATYENGERLGDAGPYAAGYIDFLDKEMRVFYPAECGSIRRPPIAGEYPLVVILHGNGAVHINYEYLGQLLATWGFVSLIPASESENDSPPEVSEYIYDRIEPFIEADLGELHPVLDGLSTTYEIAMIGHSRGCARMQNVYYLHPELMPRGVASVWLGPAQDAGLPLPGFFFLIGAELDGQSLRLTNFDPAWRDNDPPKCKAFIWGGNHSLFGDHKVYRMMDGVPTITRRQQLDIVISYVLPLMQRAFALEEHWPEQLDNPQSTASHEVRCELE